jgi:hypothetical protein
LKNGNSITMDESLTLAQNLTSTVCSSLPSTKANSTSRTLVVVVSSSSSFSLTSSSVVMRACGVFLCVTTRLNAGSTAILKRRTLAGDVHGQLKSDIESLASDGSIANV